MSRLRSQRSAPSRFSGCGGGAGVADGAHGVDDRRQRRRGGHLAVEHGERLAVVAADADLDPGAVLVDHDPGDLEALDLAERSSPCSTTTSTPASRSSSAA